MSDELIFDGSEIDDQIADAEKWARYELLSEDQLVAELNGVRSRIQACQTQLNQMIQLNECKKTKEMITNLCAQDLSLGGWPVKYVDHNKDMYGPYTSGNNRPNWYTDLTVEVKQTYELNLKYYKEIAYLREPCLAVNKLIIEMLADDMLGNGFRLRRLVKNFDESGISEKVYRNLEMDVDFISRRLNKNWDDLEDIAFRTAVPYYKQHNKESPEQAMKHYRQCRTNDYIYDFEQSVIADRFRALPNGTFVERSDMAWQVIIIDKYTQRLSVMEPYGEWMDKFSVKAKEINDTLIIPYQKNCRLDAVAGVMSALRYFLVEIMDFVMICQGIIKKFKEADVNSSPWCFMHKLEAFSSMKPKYSFQPDTSDPWEKGTHYTQMYEMAAKALGEHCTDFVKNHGHSDYRGK